MGPKLGASDGITLIPTPQFAEAPKPHPPAIAGVENTAKLKPLSVANTETLIRISCVSHVKYDRFRPKLAIMMRKRTERLRNRKLFRRVPNRHNAWVPHHLVRLSQEDD